MDNPHRILGVDPGLNRTGFGIIEIINNEASPVHFGVISNSGPLQLPEKLIRIYSQMSKIISEFRPAEMAVEEVFFSQNAQSALKLGQARASVILAGLHAGLVVFEYSANEVKKSIAAYGRASKEQMQTMVKILLKLDQPPRYNDSADALAISLCHFYSRKFRALTQTTGKLR